MTESLFPDAAAEAREAAQAFPKLARMLTSFAEKFDRAADLVAENEQLREAVEWQSSKAEARSHDG